MYPLEIYVHRANPLMANQSTSTAPAAANAATAEESADSFPADVPILAVDRIPRGPPGPPSVASTAATELASEYGLPIKEHAACLKSITFLKDQPQMGWGIRLADSVVRRRKLSSRPNSRTSSALTVESVEGSLALSRIQPGDCLKSINRKSCGPSYNAERALERMNRCLEDDGLLSVAVENKDGNDILIQATVIKPRPNMTYEELGLVVWYWGCLCVKSFNKGSIFKHSVLKPEDHIVSINNIMCDKMRSPRQFADIIGALPLEVTLTVKRRKERFSGAFG